MWIKLDTQVANGVHMHKFHSGKYFITSHMGFGEDIPKETGVYCFDNQYDILVIKTNTSGNFLSKNGKYYFNTEDVVFMFPVELANLDHYVLDFKKPMFIKFKENAFMKFEDDEFILN